VIFGSFYELGLCGEFVGMIKVGPGFFSYIWPLEFLWAWEVLNWKVWLRRIALMKYSRMNGQLMIKYG
jgi:hypothetical protein